MTPTRGTSSVGACKSAAAAIPAFMLATGIGSSLGLWAFRDSRDAASVFAPTSDQRPAPRRLRPSLLAAPRGGAREGPVFRDAALRANRIVRRVGLIGDSAGLKTKARRSRRQPNALGLAERELVLALAKDGCPVCRVLEKADGNYFFWLIHEGHSEPSIFDEMTGALGFCLEHGRALIERQNGPSALAMAHQVVASRLRIAWSDEKSRRAWESRIAARNGFPEACPLCRSRDGVRDRSLFFLLNVLKDPAVAHHYGRPGILCFPHFCRLVPRVADVMLRPLLELHRQTLAQRLTALGKTGSAGDAASEALRLAAGEDQGFGFLPQPSGHRRNGDRRDPVSLLASDMRSLRRCAVCIDVSRSWLDWVAWLDEAAERGEEIDDVLPTCPEHTWGALHAAGSALAVALVRRILSLASLNIHYGLEGFAKTPPPFSLKRPVTSLATSLRGRQAFIAAGRAALVREPGCPICVRLAIARDQSLRLLFALLEEKRHRAVFEGGYGLCLRHYARAVALDPSPEVWAFLRTIETAKLARLSWELGETGRKEAWQYRPEPKGSECSSPVRAIYRFSGRLDLDDGSGLERDA